MLELFRDVEDLEDVADLRKIYEVFKSMSKHTFPIKNTSYYNIYYIILFVYFSIGSGTFELTRNLF